MVRTTFNTVQPLTSPIYEDLDEIGRCLHFDDFEQAMERGYLVPQRLANSHKRLMKSVLWFAPCQSMSSNNYYGNVTFVVQWETVLQNLGPNLYLIDQAIYNSRSYTRVVLTSSNYDHRLEKVDLYSNTSALTKSWTGYQHVSQCFNKERNGPHELQIAIEVDLDDARWLLQNCMPVPNDHSLVNVLFKGHSDRKGKCIKYTSYRCFKFNTAQDKECPYEINEEQCEERIEAFLDRASRSYDRASGGIRAVPKQAQIESHVHFSSPNRSYDRASDGIQAVSEQTQIESPAHFSPPSRSYDRVSDGIPVVSNQAQIGSSVHFSSPSNAHRASVERQLTSGQARRISSSRNEESSSIFTQSSFLVTASIILAAPLLYALTRLKS